MEIIIADIRSRNEGGSIINIGSYMGILGPDYELYKDTDMSTDFAGDYFFHKGGMNNYTRFLASHYGRYNVRCNVLNLGGFFNNQPELFVKRYCAKTFLNRMANESDIMGAIVFLASDASAYYWCCNCSRRRILSEINRGEKEKIIMNNESIALSSKKEVFWDDFLVDKDLTTASWRVMNPVRKEACFIFDEGCEKDFGISYPCILKDENGYKMYYVVWNKIGEFSNARCYFAMIESSDGINWKRPALNIFEHPELTINNVVMDNIYDGLCVFFDKNPSCPKNEKYKAVGVYYSENENGEKHRALWCFVSPDGYRFTKKNMMTDKGFFDSLNTVMYKDGKYICYLRGYHEPNDNPSGAKVRDIRVMYSDDFINWTEPQIIAFTDGEDEPLYTNNAIIYPEANHLFVGFPVRYRERKEWTLNMEQIKSSEIKKNVMQFHEKRSGLAVTDCIFMCSRDGKLWHRYNEAFLFPAYENEHNWVYGDCYLAYGLIDSGRECYYLYAHDNHRSTHCAKPLIRYEIRKDGFACIMAESKEKTVVTKPMTFSGSVLHINFTTSAKGYIYVDVLDKDGNELSKDTSFEIFGDNIDRKIYFADGSDFSKYQGKEIRLRFKMSEAKLYSMWFD